jgi:large subunit ribosomal protein L4e
VFATDGEAPTAASSTPLPGIFLSPIRPDVVHFVHSRIAMNKRQPYCVNKYAGKMPSAASWGTGRAVSRIPRVQGGGTHRSGQAAFGNMCRGGRMFSPTKTWRKWHRKVNLTQRRYAIASAIAASGVPALVMARGHKIGETPEGPLIVSSSVENMTKTSAAVAMLKKLGAYADVERVQASKTMRAGKGKMRNRRFVQRRGPLLIFAKDGGITRACRNIPGVELADVNALNLLQLAPGGHVGRFVVWTEAAFAALDGVFGTYSTPSTSKLHNGTPYRLPQLQMSNADLSRLINSDEVQTQINPPKEGQAPSVLKCNPLKSDAALAKLNPAAAERKKRAAAEQKAPKKKKAKVTQPMRDLQAKYYKSMVAEE